jgi:hypothetical protein
MASKSGNDYCCIFTYAITGIDPIKYAAWQLHNR